MSRSTRRLILVLIALLSVKGSILWAHWSRTIADRTADAAHIAERERAVVDAAPYRADSIASAKRELVGTSDNFIIAPTPGQASTVAASLLADDARDAGVRLGTIDLHADSTVRSGVREVTVSGEITGIYADAIAFIRMVEQGRPFTVRQLAIAPATGGGAAIGAVRVRFTAMALARTLFPFER